MARIVPFSGWRFHLNGGLSRVLCPPYDVIGPQQAALLRRHPANAIHLELPEKVGGDIYQRAAALWRRWRREGLVVRDPKPGFYVCEERFRQGGRARRRRGFLAALDVRPRSAASIVAHERTLSRPKKDRLKLLSAVRLNISPIFGVFPDKRGRVRRLLAGVMRRKPASTGRLPGGGTCRLWVVDEPSVTTILSRALTGNPVFIADGHHRLEVSRSFFKRVGASEASSILIYLCAEEDEGLIVLPTHRVLEGGAFLARRAAGRCRMAACPSLPLLLKRLEREANPYAFGLFEGGRFWFCRPRAAAGCRSGLCVEWVGRHLLAGVGPEHIRYTSEARKACRMASAGDGGAVLIKPFSVSQVRRAALAVGLLPPKSTYFVPKIVTGLVFKEV